MKNDITYVAQEKFLAVLVDMGVRYETLNTWHKVEPVKNRRVYIPLTKRVGRVDLSGFEIALSEGLTKKPHCGEFGRVKQQLDMGGSEDDVLARFRLVVEHMLTLAPDEAKPAPKAKKQLELPLVAPSSPSPTPDSSAADKLAKEQADKEARRLRIEAYSLKTGIPVSPKAFAQASE